MHLADQCELSALINMLMANQCDLPSQMMIAEAHDEMEDSHWMASQRAAFSAWMELLRVPMGARHSWTRSSRRRTTKPSPPTSIAPRTEPPLKMWKSARGWRQGFEAKGLSIITKKGIIKIGIP